MKLLIHRVQKHLFGRLLIAFNILIYFLREILFGSDNATHFLSGLSEPSIVPILKLRRAKIGTGTRILSGTVFHNCKDFSNLEIGRNCHIGKECFFDLRDKITIGDNVVVAMRCNFLTHLDMSNSSLSKLYPADNAPIKVEDNSYLGLGVSILMGVVVGEESMIAAGSVVNHDLQSKTLYAGVPARAVKDVYGN